MNRYAGNSGVVERIPERATPLAHEARVSSGPVYDPNFTSRDYEAMENASPLKNIPLLGGLFGGGKAPPEQSLFGSLGGSIGNSLGGFFSKLTSQSLEIEDYLLIGMLYLLYRETKDLEFLLIAGAMFLI